MFSSSGGKESERILFDDIITKLLYRKVKDNESCAEC